MMSEVQTNRECKPVLNNPKITCAKCQLSFTKKSNFYAHMRRIHPQDDFKINRGKVCGICYEKLSTLPLLHAHITEKHDVCLQLTEETFYCEEDFLRWKSKTEREDQSNFVLRHTNLKDGIKLRYYVCHRSGLPTAPGNKESSKRKRSPSIKIGFTCPASINMISETVDGISCIKVKYQSVHVGHELGGKLRLSKEDKARLASSLNAGVSISSLLKELRENYAPSHPYRHITRKDLYNISQSFKLSKTRLIQKDDFVTVDFVVQKIFNSDIQASLLVYKPVGDTLPEYPALNENDFLLGIMNDVQEKLLEIYGNTCIMVDYTDCENFYVSILMVRDEKWQTLPVATFFSSKISVEMLEPFFVAIHGRLPQLKARAIMSDDVISFYNAWQKVFKDEPQHLLCSWYVRRNLFRNVEVKVNKEKRKVLKNRLNTFLKEEAIGAFEFKMKTFIKEYETVEKDFITYFKTNYELRAKKWAYCYRIALGINPEMRLERWRDNLKLDEKGTVGKRLDKTLSIVCSIVSKKLINNNIVMDAAKLSDRILLCQKFHEECLSLGDKCDVVEVDEKKCTISQFENGKNFSYVIEKMDFCECGIRCEACNVCIHSMSCTCVDYCVQFVICKHIHRFCGSFGTASNVVVVSQGRDDCFSSCDNKPVHSSETGDVKPTKPVSNPHCVIDDVKARVKSQLQLLENRIEDVNYLEVMKTVEERMISINSYLDDSISPCKSSEENLGQIEEK